MTEVKDDKQEKKFVVIGTASIFTKYKIKDKLITVHLIDGSNFTGKIKWYDDYAIKLFLSEDTGSITVPIHNILYYECEHFLLENEKVAKLSKRVFRGVAKSTDKERQQLVKYKFRKVPVHFYLKNGLEIRGKIKWYVDHSYFIETEEGDRDYQIIKRHILYYKKIKPEKPKRTDKGSIKMVNMEKGFGFIIYEKGDLFFHRSEIVDNWEELEPGQEVEFGVTEGKKGYVAVNIKVIG